jgi:hypothetical protein
VKLAFLLYLVPGILIVGFHAKSAIQRNGHNGARVVVTALVLATLTWPVIFTRFFRRR